MVNPRRKKVDLAFGKLKSAARGLLGGFGQKFSEMLIGYY